jgi:hypothetical protein
MARVVISDIQTTTTISEIKPTITAENISNGTSTVSNIALGLMMSAATISPLVTVSDLTPISSGIVSVDYAKVVTVTDILPFRLTITNIGIEGYRQDNPPGIGVQVIGFSNYIL